MQDEQLTYRLARDATRRDASVSALLRVLHRQIACYVFAHGAGSGMAHPFMHEVAESLAERHAATLRFQSGRSGPIPGVTSP